MKPSFGLAPALACLATMAAAQQPAREGAYLTKVAGNVIAREHYRLADGLLSAEIELVTQSLRLTTETRYDGGLIPLKFHLAARGAAADPVLQELEATFSDSARWSMTAGGARQGSVTPLVPPFAVLQNLQFSHVALLLLRYDRARGGKQSFNAWTPQGAQSLPATLQLSGDSGSVELAGIAMHVVLDGSGWLRDAAVPSQSLTVTWQAALEPAPKPLAGGSADTLPPAAALESPYRFPSGSLTLGGTLTLPKGAAGPVPVAVIVAGSGPTDRNGNSLLGIKPNSYAQLAWRLAERGIASLRYDKRGMPATQGRVDMFTTSFDDFVADVSAAASALAADPRFSRVVILGHSEGAGLGLLAANRGAPVAGVALLAGLGRPFAVVLREQLAAQFDAATLAQWDSAFARYLRGEEAGALPDALRPLVAPANRRFLQTAVGYDPVKEVRAAKVAVLIVQGGTDIQVSVADARALAAARPAATLLIIADANHVFKRAPTRDRTAQTAQYMDPTLPIVPELVDAVARWIAGLGPRP